MIDVDISWLPVPLRKDFTRGVQLFADAVRTGQIQQYEDAAQAMRRVGQMRIMSDEGVAPDRSDGGRI